mmetsp:Transcript_168535/g.541678  ORF Transcript_168535/g.541678 Transcript_168535/m.541678 type:complete len:203 (-) Transcript_168535:891-1499(-)
MLHRRGGHAELGPRHHGPRSRAGPPGGGEGLGLEVAGLPVGHHRGLLGAGLPRIESDVELEPALHQQGLCAAERPIRYSHDEALAEDVLFLRLADRRRPRRRGRSQTSSRALWLWAVGGVLALGTRCARGRGLWKLDCVCCRLLVWALISAKGQYLGRSHCRHYGQGRGEQGPGLCGAALGGHRGHLLPQHLRVPLLEDSPR